MRNWLDPRGTSQGDRGPEPLHAGSALSAVAVTRVELRRPHRRRRLRAFGSSTRTGAESLPAARERPFDVEGRRRFGRGSAPCWPLWPMLGSGLGWGPARPRAHPSRSGQARPRIPRAPLLARAEAVTPASALVWTPTSPPVRKRRRSNRRSRSCKASLAAPSSGAGSR